MIEILREPDITRISRYRQLLESEGIRTFVRNEHLSSADISIPLFHPALCLLDPSEHRRALELIDEFERAPSGDPSAEILCATCGETSPGSFAQCWNCHGELPA